MSENLSEKSGVFQRKFLLGFSPNKKHKKRKSAHTVISFDIDFAMR